MVDSTEPLRRPQVAPADRQAPTTKLDFYVPDQYTPDNTGGIALNVTLNSSGVPEPATFWLVVPALAAGCLRLLRRMSQR